MTATTRADISTTRHGARMVQRHASWKPGILPFLIPFLVLLGFGMWSYLPNSTPMAWVLTIVWSLPVVGVMVGLQGALLIRRRVRRSDEMVPAAPAEDDFLIALVPTIGRHDTYPALERSVLSYVEHLPNYFPHLRIDVLTEEGCEAAERIQELEDRSPLIRVVSVPKAYATANGTRFKARANHYSHELRIAEEEALENVWVLHMDDDTAVGPDTAAAVAQFINRQRRAHPDETKHMAQGILTYPRENAVNMFTWLADAVRPADDIARFRALTGTGTPVAGVHGELLLLRANIEATIGWDFGPKAIVEDAQLALNFCRLYPGRSDWFNGRCYGASPATARDFIKQRERWAWGLVALCFNRTIPLRYRWFLAICVTTWILGPLQHIGAVLLIAWFTGNMNTSPVAQSVVVLWSLNFAYVVWTYWEGLRLNALVSISGRRKWWEPMVVVGLIPLFSILEGLGGFRGFIKFVRREENKFVVIAKPA
ncbi:glycosyltransferase family 2 protein [Streptomyces sp. NPDC054961]